MRRLYLSIIAAATAIGFASAPPLAAQGNRLGFRFSEEIPDWREVGPDTPSNFVLMKTAECVAKKRGEKTAALLGTLPASEAEDRAVVNLLEDGVAERCLPPMNFNSIGNARRAQGLLRLKVDPMSFRGALAEALMRAEKMEVSPDAPFSTPDEAMFAAEHFHGLKSLAQERAFGLEFAGCVAGNNWAKLGDLLATDAGSPEEKAQIMAMAPTFSGCVFEGQRLSLDAPTLRHQIAETVYYSIMGAPDA